MKFSVYQINFTSEQYREINATDGNVDYYQLYLNASNFPKPEQVIAAKHLYKKVAEIEAGDLEDVFKIGNIGPETSITRLGRMHSVSVGDVVVDDAGTSYFVASFGFGLLPIRFGE